MPNVGDRVRLASRKVGQDPRTGVVTGVRGQMISVRWSAGEESSILPGPGTLTVIGRGRAPRKAVRVAKKASVPKGRTVSAKTKAAPTKGKATSTRKSTARRKASGASKGVVPTKKRTVLAKTKKASGAKKASKRPGRRR